MFFLRRFLANPREVGALMASSRHLGAAMIDGIDLAPGDLVVEYGPGTGSLTAVIRDRIRAVGGVRFLGIEREPGFCRILARRMPELTFVEGSVEDVQRHLAEHGLPRPKAILSGLPLILLPTMTSIVRTAAELLADGGSFRTFSYLQSFPLPNARRLRRLMATEFANFAVRSVVLRTFPPALVLSGEKMVPGTFVSLPPAK